MEAIESAGLGSRGQGFEPATPTAFSTTGTSLCPSGGHCWRTRAPSRPQSARYRNNIVITTPPTPGFQKGLFTNEPKIEPETAEKGEFLDGLRAFCMAMDRAPSDVPHRILDHSRQVSNASHAAVCASPTPVGVKELSLGRRLQERHRKEPRPRRGRRGCRPRDK